MFYDLFNKCAEFEKFTKDVKISIVDNSEPLLKHLSDLKDFEDRIEFADKTFPEKLGGGSSRIVYKLNDELIIKIAYNEKGIAQNLVEAQPEMQKECVNNVLIADAEGKWTIIPFTEKITEEDFKKYIGIGFDQFKNSLYYKFNAESDDWIKPKNYDEIEKNKFFRCIAELILENDLVIGDIAKSSSFGVVDGKIVLRDGGLDRDVYDEYYSDHRSSSGHKTSL
jgi:hypothetical protein